MDRLNAGENLVQNQQVYSPMRKYTLWMQGDGNLVLYQIGSPNKSVWQTNTVNGAGNYASMQKDGNFVVYDKNNKAIWHAASNRANFNGALVITDEGKISILDLVKDVNSVSPKS